MIRAASKAAHRKMTDLNLKNTIPQVKTLMISGSATKACPV